MKLFVQLDLNEIKADQRFCIFMAEPKCIEIGSFRFMRFCIQHQIKKMKTECGYGTGYILTIALLTYKPHP